MLSRSVTRLVSKNRIKTISSVPGTSNNNIRMYYNDPDTVDDLANHLRERQLLIAKREDADALTSKKSMKLSVMEIFKTDPPPRHGLRTGRIPDWWAAKLKAFRIKDQSAHKKRHTVLGYDLAAAHFVLYRKGKVRFKNQSDWVEPKSFGSLPIPNAYDSKYLVEALDLSDTEIEYEGLVNLSGLFHLKWLSFKDSLTVNDWTIDKISAEYPNLEYLDISGCVHVTERGLEALYRAPSLKTLIVTNQHNSPAFELSCYMLEDVNPNLRCIIHAQYETSNLDNTQIGNTQK